MTYNNITNSEQYETSGRSVFYALSFDCNEYNLLAGVNVINIVNVEK